MVQFFQMEELRTLVDLWPILATIGGLIAFVFSIKHRVSRHSELIKQSQDDIKELKIKHEIEVSKLFEQLGQVKESLARIEGALGVNRERS